MTNPFLTEVDIVVRLALSFAAGVIIGFERASRRQVAGMRTHVIICLGATLLMILSIWLPQEFSQPRNGDPGRIAAQVVSGIGFLGAGAMIRLGNNVRGLTTAASLWLIAAVGMTIGAGQYLAAAVTEGLALIALWGLGKFEFKIFPAERNKTLELSFKNGVPDITDLINTVKSFGVRVLTVDVAQAFDQKGAKLRLLVGFPSATDIGRLLRALKSIKGLENVDIKEKY
ncbi:MAG: MgtC/SapB family protein [Treponema sp.]|jgi:putative Mg2+ transporter-C (MgtC) family protein|nr:MgtC/SapB family protein [Treponema sp.]